MSASKHASVHIYHQNPRIVTAFQSFQLTKDVLEVSPTLECQLTLIPEEGAGELSSVRTPNYPCDLLLLSKISTQPKTPQRPPLIPPVIRCRETRIRFDFFIFSSISHSNLQNMSLPKTFKAAVINSAGSDFEIIEKTLEVCVVSNVLYQIF